MFELLTSDDRIHDRTVKTAHFTKAENDLPKSFLNHPFFLRLLSDAHDCQLGLR